MYIFIHIHIYIYIHIYNRNKRLCKNVVSIKNASVRFWFLEVAQVPRGSEQLRKVRRIRFHLSRYLSDSVVSSYDSSRFKNQRLLYNM